ncbi:transmembrane protein, putative [Medicago truncatula]|uniref:Transmembrane protein, putative n=1 Tax=Medicago truncatula TaxID=3880 RepID=A0A072TG32_MEDTR|nr:transmembrane protein, putative [Medicago truncatula]
MKLLSLAFTGAVIILQIFLMEFPPSSKINDTVSFQNDCSSFALLISYVIARSIKKRLTRRSIVCYPMGVCISQFLHVLLLH